MSVTWTRRCDGAALDTIAGLNDPLRRRIYQRLADSTVPLGRDEVAAAVGVKRSLAGYHLDRLAHDGLLVITYLRRSGRSGPGAGRPAKLYNAAPVEITVQLPARDDTLIAHLLATAIEADPSGAARQALRHVARAAGTTLGQELAPGGDLVHALGRRGYAPTRQLDAIALRNCPFHHLVDEHRALVCSLNLDLLGAAADAANTGLVAELDPQPEHCCVRLVTATG